MKKFTVFGAALLLGTAVNVQAQDVTYPRLHRLRFLTLLHGTTISCSCSLPRQPTRGRKYPTKEEFEAAVSISTWSSRVRTCVLPPSWRMPTKTSFPMCILPVGCG